MMENYRPSHWMRNAFFGTVVMTLAGGYTLYKAGFFDNTRQPTVDVANSLDFPRDLPSVIRTELGAIVTVQSIGHAQTGAKIGNNKVLTTGHVLTENCAGAKVDAGAPTSKAHASRNAVTGLATTFAGEVFSADHADAAVLTVDGSPDFNKLPNIPIDASGAAIAPGTKVYIETNQPAKGFKVRDPLNPLSQPTGVIEGIYVGANTSDHDKAHRDPNEGFVLTHLHDGDPNAPNDVGTVEGSSGSVVVLADGPQAGEAIGLVNYGWTDAQTNAPTLFDSDTALEVIGKHITYNGRPLVDRSGQNRPIFGITGVQLFTPADVQALNATTPKTC